MALKQSTKRNDTGAFIQVDNLALLKRDLALLVDSEVLVGVPEGEDSRDDGSPIGNAARAYIHDNGAPEANIPARPFMEPGIMSAQVEITKALAVTALSVLKNSQQKQPKNNIVERGLHAVGMVAVSAIKNKIAEGIPPPLSDRTLRARAAKTPSRKAEREELAARRRGEKAGTDRVKPLIDTGEMMGSIKHVLRSKKERKDA